MSIPPITARRPASPETERRRARMVVLLATLGIAASLLAYAISPGVRHAVGHAAHSVSGVLDKDKHEHAKPKTTSSGSPSPRSSTTGGVSPTGVAAQTGGTPAESGGG